MRPFVIIRHCGISLLIISALILFSALIAFFEPADNSFWPLTFSFLAAFGCGFAAVRYTSPIDYIYVREGYVIVLASWITAWLFGALPYLIYGGEFTFVNSLFESMSGFTTTGASILNDI